MEELIIYFIGVIVATYLNFICLKYIIKVNSITIGDILYPTNLLSWATVLSLIIWICIETSSKKDSFFKTKIWERKE